MNTNPVIDQYGTQKWYNSNSDLHRLDGPAIICTNGLQGWYVNSKAHRLDGPAIIWPDGRTDWYVNGERHRLDGPAVIYANGSLEWYVNGNYITNKVEDWMENNSIQYPLIVNHWYCSS